MKKVSTRAAVQIRNISQQKLTVGLDLGDRNSDCVLDDSGQIQLEQRVRTNAKALREVFGEMPHSRDRTGNRDAFALENQSQNKIAHCKSRTTGRQTDSSTG